MTDDSLQVRDETANRVRSEDGNIFHPMLALSLAERGGERHRAAVLGRSSNPSRNSRGLSLTGRQTRHSLHNQTAASQGIGLAASCMHSTDLNDGLTRTPRTIDGHSRRARPLSWHRTRHITCRHERMARAPTPMSRANAFTEVRECVFFFFLYWSLAFASYMLVLSGVGACPRIGPAWSSGSFPLPGAAKLSFSI